MAYLVPEPPEDDDSTLVEDFAILGNWEYWGAVDLNDLRAVYAKHGATLLENTEVMVELRGRKVRVMGLDDFTAGHPKHDLLTVPTAADSLPDEISIPSRRCTLNTAFRTHHPLSTASVW